LKPKIGHTVRAVPREGSDFSSKERGENERLLINKYKRQNIYD